MDCQEIPKPNLIGKVSSVNFYPIGASIAGIDGIRCREQACFGFAKNQFLFADHKEVILHDFSNSLYVGVAGDQYSSKVIFIQSQADNRVKVKVYARPLPGDLGNLRDDMKNIIE